MAILNQKIDHLVIDAEKVLHGADLLIEGDRVAGYGNDLAVPEGAEIIDGSGLAVFPGFVNAHTHLWQMALMGRRDDLVLSDWCDQVLTPMLNALYATEDADVIARRSYLWTALGICCMLRSGITSFLDMDLNYCQDSMFKAAKEAGVRGYFGVELADWFLEDDNAENGDIEEIRRLLKAHPGPGVLTPSELNICRDETLSFALEAAKDNDTLIQIHVDETSREALLSVSERGESELVHLDNLSPLDERFSAVHGIYLTREEIDLAAKRGITVVYNPKSNMKLGSGVCPIRELLNDGINVAIATDGPASNDRLDMFEEMRAGVMLQKVDARDASAVVAGDVFSMATKGGAQMLRLEAGSLEKGCLADFCTMPLTRPHLINGGDDIISTIVYCAASGDVRDVYVGGKAVFKDYRTLAFDEEALTKEFLEHVKHLEEESHV